MGNSANLQNVRRHFTIHTTYEEKNYYNNKLIELVDKIRNTRLLIIGLFIAFIVLCQSRKKDVISINQADYEEIKRIDKLAYSLTDTIDSISHNRFWTIIDKYGGDPKKIDNLGDKQNELDYINEFLPYERMFYEDALVSLKAGKPFQSEKRRLLGEKLLPKIRQEKEELMLKITLRQPITFQNTKIILDENAIHRILENMDFGTKTTKKKLDILYDRNYYK